MQALFAQQVPAGNFFMLGGPLGIVSNLLGLVSFVCFILVLIKMFQNGQTGLGIGCIVGAFCFGIGVLVAFIFGWIKSSEWNLKTVMLVWTAVVVVNLALVGYIVSTIQIPAQ